MVSSARVGGKFVQTLILFIHNSSQTAPRGKTRPRVTVFSGGRLGGGLCAEGAKILSQLFTNCTVRKDSNSFSKV